MNFPELKHKFKNSLVMEFFINFKCFYGKNKKIVFAMFVFVIICSVLISPYMYRIIYNEPEIEHSSVNNDNEVFAENIKICISGEIKNPGTLTMTTDDRVEDAIKKAGGITQDADLTNINLSQKLEDEQYIFIPSKKSEVNTDKSNDKSANKSKPSKKAESINCVININTANAQQLQQLPGIGEVMSQRIIDYRNNVGNFEDTRDVMSVKGIGEKLYNKIKNYITI